MRKFMLAAVLAVVLLSPLTASAHGILPRRVDGVHCHASPVPVVAYYAVPRPVVTSYYVAPAPVVTSYYVAPAPVVTSYYAPPTSTVTTYYSAPAVIRTYQVVPRPVVVYWP